MDRAKWLRAGRACAAVLLWAACLIGVAAPAGCRQIGDFFGVNRPGGQATPTDDPPPPPPRENSLTPRIAVERAGEAFSAAADEDLKASLAGQPASAAARQGYERALKLLAGISSTEEANLGKLTRKKLTVQALSQWRVREFRAAGASGARAERVAPAPGARPERDDYLLMALPGLIRNDQAFDMVTAKKDGQTGGNFRDVRDLLVDLGGGAVKYIAAARAAAEANGHEVRGYLLMAELGAYSNLSEAYEQFGQDQATFLAEHGATVQSLLEKMTAAGVPAPIQEEMKTRLPL